MLQFMSDFDMQLINKNKRRKELKRKQEDRQERLERKVNRPRNNRISIMDYVDDDYKEGCMGLQFGTESSNAV